MEVRILFMQRERGEGIPGLYCKIEMKTRIHEEK
jgi:hypothetical protein